MTTTTAPTAVPQRTATSRRAPLQVLGPPFHRLLYLLSAIPLGALWLVLLITGWVLVVVLAITPLLPAALVAFDTSLRFAAWVEGHLARRLLGAPVAPRRLAPPRPGYWRSIGAVLGDRRFWTSQAFLVLRFALGLVTAILVVSVLAAGLEGVLAPIIHRVIPTGDSYGIDVGFWVVDTFAESVLLIPLGLVLLAWGFGLLLGCAALWRRLATSILGGRA
jgi:hypothetical protein